MDYIYSLYKWEATAILDGLSLQLIDRERINLALAIDISSASNAKDPKRAIKKRARDLDEKEYGITGVRVMGSDKVPTAQGLEALKEAFSKGG